MRFTFEISDEPHDRPVTISVEIGCEDAAGDSRVVAGAASADLTQASEVDALSKTDEQGDGEGRRRTGFTA